MNKSQGMRERPARRYKHQPQRDFSQMAGLCKRKCKRSGCVCVCVYVCSSLQTNEAQPRWWKCQGEQTLESVLLLFLVSSNTHTAATHTHKDKDPPTLYAAKTTLPLMAAENGALIPFNSLAGPFTPEEDHVGCGCRCVCAHFLPLFN